MFEEADREAKEYFDLLRSDDQKKEHFSRLAIQAKMYQDRFTKILKRVSDVKQSNQSLQEKLKESFNVIQKLINLVSSTNRKLAQVEAEVIYLKSELLLQGRSFAKTRDS